MAVLIAQSPGEYNLAYGPNAVTLRNAPAGAKYVLQLWDPAGPLKFADVRSNPNANGRAIFDIQNLIQAYVLASKIDIEKTDKWSDSAEEVFTYEIRYGTEIDGEVEIDGTATGFVALPGRKEYYEVLWNFNAYRATVSTDGESPCTVINSRGLPLTDWVYSKPASSITDGKPAFLEPTDPVYTQPVRMSDNFTLSYLQELVFGGFPPATAKGIEVFRVDTYNAAGTKLNDFIVPNIVEFGGGPNTAIGEGIAIVDPYWVVTAGVGPANPTMAATLPVGTHHYYVSTPVVNDPVCGGDYDGLTDKSAFEVYRFDIVDDACNDFTPIQFSWMNSLGFRDYFHFTKRNEKSLQMTRNEFLQEAADYNALTYTVDQGQRGYTTYSQKIEQQWTANTRFLSDDEAAFLENLFVSPDVRVRFGDDTVWLPVQVLTNTYTQRTYRKDKLFQYEVTFKLAHDLKSQRA